MFNSPENENENENENEDDKSEFDYQDSSTKVYETNECNLCYGTGLGQNEHTSCPKCKGSGTINK